MYILGVSAFYHDSAACIIKNGKIIAAAQEERFSRIKHDANFPKNAIDYCLDEAGINPNEILNVVFYEKPFLKFERILETFLAFAPSGFGVFIKAMPLWIKEKLFQKILISQELSKNISSSIDWKKKLLFCEHHLSHAASAFYPSPYETAAILTLDGVGEWTTTSVAVGNGKSLEIKKEIHFPHSLGLLYSAFTYYLGFKVNSGEYKVMGLASYGKPRYAEIIKDKLINIFEDGSFQLDMSYFNYATGLTMTNKKFNLLFDGPPRNPESPLTQREMDLASSIQSVLEDIVIKLAKKIAHDTGKKNLCLAGGVALNCVVNGILSREKIFEKIWIQPASGDAGGSLGAALATWHLHFNKERYVNKKQDSMNGAFLGPRYENKDIFKELRNLNASFKEYNDDEIINIVAEELNKGKAIGWMQGRMEFGPRALGARSIIADPRSPFMQKQLNLKIKYRESFRPFAPSILIEDIDEWFDDIQESPYMLLVSKIKKAKRTKSKTYKEFLGVDKINEIRSVVPAITHVDMTARIQTVHFETNQIYHKLLSKFKEITGCPILVNTSFNVRGEPIVCSPKDAFKCFMGTELDILVIGNYLLHKDNQDKNYLLDYKNQYEMD